MMPWREKGAIAAYLINSRGDCSAADLCEDIMMDGCQDPIEAVDERATQERFAVTLPKREALLWMEIFGTDKTVREIAEYHGLTRETMARRIAKLIIRYLDFREG